MLGAVVHAPELDLGFVGPRAPAPDALVALPLLFLGETKGVRVAHARGEEQESVRG